ncbi:hypothetical protein EVAR_98936_1 [Eumeta japonica]|uniref:Uncharacterized protein n=1 Tax=Eumeta variegata TaxID=151549 RepID=A0A4C1ZXZ4_EUMVA|nr:hypothetical protein EVAR_98936_1 [Eumeta japonica]
MLVTVILVRPGTGGRSHPVLQVWIRCWCSSRPESHEPTAMHQKQPRIADRGHKKFESRGRIRVFLEESGRATRSLQGKEPAGQIHLKRQEEAKSVKRPQNRANKTKRRGLRTSSNSCKDTAEGCARREATINDNDSQTNLRGKMNTIHMAAYSVTRSLVNFMKNRRSVRKTLSIIIPLYDPIVVTARC